MHHKPLNGWKRGKLLLKMNLVILYIVILLYSFVNRMLTTPLTSFGLSMGLSGLALGLIQNGCEFTCMAGRPLAGYCMDSGRRKLALILSFSMMIAAALICAAAEKPAIYIFARLFQSFVIAFVSSVMSSLLPSEVPTALLGTAMAISTALTNMGSAYAPALSKYLFAQYGFPVAYLAAAGASATALVIIVLFLRLKDLSEAEHTDREKKTEKFSCRELFSGLSGTVLPACTIGLFANITKDINEYYTVQLGIDRGIDVTTGIALAGTLAIFIGVVAGIAIDKFKPQRILIPAFAAMALSCFLYSRAQTTAMATVAAVFYRIGIGSYWPALMVQCCYLLPHRKGAAVATLYFFMDIVSLLNNTLLGYLYDRVGASQMYLVVGIINLVAIAYYLLLRRFYLSKYELSEPETE